IEKGIFSETSEINELIENDKMTSINLSSQTATSRRSYDMSHTDLFKSHNIRPVVYLGRTQMMLSSMSSQNHGLNAADLAGHEWRRWFSILRVHFNIVRVL